eukprot:777904-Prorocentrum_minimum.AAC.2
MCYTFVTPSPHAGPLVVTQSSHHTAREGAGGGGFRRAPMRGGALSVVVPRVKCPRVEFRARHGHVVSVRAHILGEN